MIEFEIKVINTTKQYIVIPNPETKQIGDPCVLVSVLSAISYFTNKQVWSVEKLQNEIGNNHIRETNFKSVL